MTPTTPPAIPSDIPAEVWAEARLLATYRHLDEARMDIARALLAAQERGKLMERERCAAYHDEWEAKHLRLADERPDHAEFHHEMSLRHRVYSKAIRKGAE